MKTCLENNLHIAEPLISKGDDHGHDMRKLPGELK